MDILKIIRSLEELLYEVMTWLLFYPRTLWRCIRHPDWIVAYTDKELGESPGEQFTDLMSPPLFLIVSILVAHGIELSLGDRLDSMSHSAIAGQVLASEQGVLMFRALFFAVIPLVMASGLLRARGIAIDRETLRSPFFMQCYLAAPFAVVMSSSSAFVRAPQASLHWVGVAMAVLAIAWLVVVETRWLRLTLRSGRGKALAHALALLALALAIDVGIAFLVVAG